MAGAENRQGSELGTRTLTALVMVLVSGTALWLGGLWWLVFVLLVGAGVWFEWSALCLLMYPPGARRTLWRAGGAIYTGIAAAMLLTLRDIEPGGLWVLIVVGAVIVTDVGAYFAGRLIGGPKIAPAISPSKTWAGLLGGMVAAGFLGAVALGFVTAAASAMATSENSAAVWPALTSGAALGASVAIIAQAGDFFESWMKRKAGVKDSGNLLPGHGGLFDRLDGLLLVLVVLGMIFLIARLSGAI